MQFNSGVINMGQTPGILAKPFAQFPSAAGLEGRIALATDTLKIYRAQGGAWVEYSAGGGGSLDWDGVLALLGAFTANRTADIAGHSFTMHDGANNLLEILAATQSMGDLTGGSPKLVLNNAGNTATFTCGAVDSRADTIGFSTKGAIRTEDPNSAGNFGPAVKFGATSAVAPTGATSWLIVEYGGTQYKIQVRIP